jgi:hypothetical protein
MLNLKSLFPPSARLLDINNLLLHHTIFLATTRASPYGLLIRTGYMSTNADVFPELTSRKPGFEHLIDLLERAILDLGQVEVDPYHGEEAGRSPDPAYAELV